MRLALQFRSFLSGLLLSALCSASFVVESVAQDRPCAIAIHGGADSNPSSDPEVLARKKAVLTEALHAGHQILTTGGSSLDAVVAAIRVMEDSPLFNAGKGAVLTNEGTAELDSSIMDGQTLNAGAVASVKHVKNPIALARLVLEKSPHVLLIGDGAEAFGKEQKVEMVENEYFITEKQRAAWKAIRDQKTKDGEKSKQVNRDQLVKQFPNANFGTVGAVALDQDGNLAAGTSTGGLMYKAWGRVGDSPIIGAGTYADNETCAVSATGTGEYFIRGAIAYDITAMMRYKGASVIEAANSRIYEKLTHMGGTGGVIAMDRAGVIVMPYNTKAMNYGWIDPAGQIEVGQYPAKK